MTHETGDERAPERTPERAGRTGAPRMQAPAPRVRATLDYPPIWLAGFLALSWGARDVIHLPPLPVIGGLLIALGVALMSAAVATMFRHRTTIIPHNTPAALVTSGVFRVSRNPIYLGDVFTLVGFSLLCGSLIGVASAVVFVAVISRRFISIEERKLQAAFGTEFAAWSSKTRRWL